MKASFKIAVLIFGPPGSGKGTQAELLAGKLGLIHFDTGRYLREIIYDPKNQKDTVIRRERINSEAGRLMTPTFVLEIVKRKTKAISKAGWGIVFSGSPRTVYEAFGDKKHIGLIETFKNLYGKQNIHIFFLNVKPDTSLKRNSKRLICSNCDKPLLAFYRSSVCPFCGARLKKRADDNPRTIKARLEEFRKRTDPIFKKLKENGYRINQIDGEQAPYKVLEQIIRQL